MRILGLITARGGSKGVPGKNTKLLGGKPLIAYTIEAALQSKLLTDWVVSTDCEKIADVALGFGANVPFVRPSELANDSSKSIDVVIHAIQEMEKQGKTYDAVVLLQPTSPFRPVGFIDKAIEIFIEKKCDALVSVLPVPHEYNPHWVFEMNVDGSLQIATGEQEIIPRRQELPPAFHRDGSIYISLVSLIEGKKVLVGGKTGGIISDPTYYANLDTMEDWVRAEATFEKLYKRCAE